VDQKRVIQPFQDINLLSYSINTFEFCNKGFADVFNRDTFVLCTMFR